MIRRKKKNGRSRQQAIKFEFECHFLYFYQGTNWTDKLFKI